MPQVKTCIRTSLSKLKLNIYLIFFHVHLLVLLPRSVLVIILCEVFHDLVKGGHVFVSGNRLKDTELLIEEDEGWIGKFAKGDFSG